MKENYEIYSLEDIKNELNERKVLRIKIQRNFEFEIADYILDDIIDGYDFLHICLMINMAKLNNRISEKDSIDLKIGKMIKWRKLEF